MSAWGWPQWVIAVVIAFMIIGAMSPPRRDTDFLAVPIWFCIAWVLWMGGFWS